VIDLGPSLEINDINSVGHQPAGRNLVWIGIDLRHSIARCESDSQVYIFWHAREDVWSRAAFFWAPRPLFGPCMSGIPVCHDTGFKAPVEQSEDGHYAGHL
jgi:hypothetical protein